ncbi:hypothetical protein MGYG_04828 [Nannizzia gypsea CBS 118893]|uniref:Secreted protein n=1 Tax=Arthroderma gypseum (strain ATCC MYA-4604 / CBS 118893) TaxID=535722 RepID=E4UX29_ARTGP|nr:hypothetical protein MGYG_04828 [Nannizzia gypsea CBS 118893]EFR01829.1 hypothetical protein MGYG_04828 [Nannizzia gypsea CBS 118893]
MSVLSRAVQLAFVALGLCLFFSNLVAAQPIAGPSVGVSIKAVNGVCRADKPCELEVTVSNANSKNPATILTWNTPLDSLADQLGVFEVRDTKGAVVPLDFIQVRRMTPPPASDLVEIKPSGSVKVKVALNTLSTAELPAGTKYTVKATGWWQAVWNLPKQEVVKTHLQEQSGAFSGDFNSNTVQVTKVRLSSNI